MIFFGWMAAILAVLSIMFFIPVLNDYIKTGLVAKFPTLIVCGFAMLAALLSLFAGMILTNIEQQSKREFEFNRVILKKLNSNNEKE